MKNFEVDIVIPWVDGSDKKWIEKKNKYLPQEKQIDIEESANRYRDWDNLQYVLRSIEKFAPWVRKVFLITDCQKPKWLNVNCDKLVLVDHKDYIPAEYLPTFSSHPIELNMHRIKDLSEHFIYFNDDCFFSKSVKKEDFFDKNGLPKIVAMECPKSVDGFVIDNIFNNDARLINKKFNKKATKKKLAKKWFSLKNPVGFFMNTLFSIILKSNWLGFYIEHLPAPFLKSEIVNCWEEFYETLDNTSKNKFRSAYDVNQYLFTEYLLCTGKFVPDRVNRKGMHYGLDDNKVNNIDYACKMINKQKHKIVCLNDGNVKNFKLAKEKINKALDTILPEKSSFEL